MHSQVIASFASISSSTGQHLNFAPRHMKECTSHTGMSQIIMLTSLVSLVFILILTSAAAHVATTALTQVCQVSK